MSTQGKNQPLAGIRVLDFTTIVLGPLASLGLADLGAEIIKVEPPEGDGIRNAGAARNPGMGSIFLALNRNKKSIALDLSRPEARPVLERLVGKVDVVLHNMRPDAARGLGIDYETLARINPRIIHCSASGFARGSERQDDPAVDDVIQAASGIAALFSTESEPPRYVPALLADKVSGLVLGNAVLAALLARERFGHGQAVEVPMFETMAGFALLEHLGGRTFMPPQGKACYQRLVTPYRRPMRTKDGYLAFTPYSKKHWQRFFHAAGRPDLADDPRVTDAKRRNAEIGDLYALLAGLLPEKPTAEWMALARREGIPAAPVQSFDEIIAGGTLEKAGVLVAQHHPDEGDVLAISALVRLGDGVPLTSAPRLGAQNAEILGWAGYSPAEIVTLREAGILRTHESPTP